MHINVQPEQQTQTDEIITEIVEQLIFKYLAIKFVNKKSATRVDIIKHPYNRFYYIIIID